METGYTGMGVRGFVSRSARHRQSTSDSISSTGLQIAYGSTESTCSNPRPESRKQYCRVVAFDGLHGGLVEADLAQAADRRFHARFGDKWKVGTEQDVPLGVTVYQRAPWLAGPRMSVQMPYCQVCGKQTDRSQPTKSGTE